MTDYEALLEANAPREDAPHQSGELAAIMYTGGTTARPKGVMLTHGSLYINALSSVAAVPRPTQGAAPIDAALLEQTMAVLPDVSLSQAYGMTELSPSVAVAVA
ncbi:MAG: AMP-binding protein [Burkholderiaceae bacterium]|nr:AMP-binding protein [Burkholderiaceae bacterium]